MRRRLAPDELARLVGGLIVIAVAVVVGAAGIYLVVVRPIVAGGAAFDPSRLTVGEWLFVASWFGLLGTNLYLLFAGPRK